MLTEGDDPSIALIHVVDLITNKGRQDGKMVGAAAAVMPCARKGQMNPDQVLELGEGISQYDVDAFGISLAGRCILSYLRAGG
jgi:hypothetical protein